MFNVFEQPWGLLGAAVIVLLILLVFRGIFPGKRRWRQWLLPVLIAVAGFGLDYYVQTDNEKIKAVIKTVMEAVEQEDVGTIEKYISDNYRDSSHSTKKNLTTRLKHRLSRPLVKKNVTRIVTTDIQQWEATAVFTVRILFDEQSHIYQSYKSQAFVKIEMNLEKQLDGRWLIKRAELLELDLMPVSWRDVHQNW